MTTVQAILVACPVLALALWLMLPRGRGRGFVAGAVLAIVALGLLGGHLPLVGRWAASSLFFVLAGITVIAGIGTVTMRSPVYCALWFALSLLGTAGLFLFQGAQFLGVATVVVYAGAIVVTFLFVLMLAQPGGDAYFDRISWQAPVSAGVGGLMVLVLSVAISGSFASGGGGDVVGPDESDLRAGVLNENHVATLGAHLYGEHLIAVEVAGLLLLVALIAATAIVTYGQASARSRDEMATQPHALQDGDGRP